MNRSKSIPMLLIVAAIILVLLVLLRGGASVSQKTSPQDTSSPQAVESQIPANESVEELSARLGFEEDVVRMIQSESGGKLSQLLDPDDKPVNGITASWATARVDGRVDNNKIATLQSALLPRGYFAFYTMDTRGEAIALIHSADPYDALRLLYTNGINYDVSTEDLIARLEQWHQQFSFTIVGVGSDFLELSLDSLPADVDAFAREVYAFCPDSVDQGTQTVYALAKEIREKKRIFLWWD